MSTTDGEVDIHGTDQSAFPKVLGVCRHHDMLEAVVLLNFRPTTAQLLSLHEHLRSWHPDA